MARKGVPGCQTCKDRKIRCSLEEPDCYNCIRSRKRCHRQSGLKLSWTRSSNRQRLIVGPRVPTHKTASSELEQITSLHFINLSTKDVSSAQNSTSWLQPATDHNALPLPGPINSLPQFTTHVEGLDLIHYFYETAPLVLLRPHHPGVSDSLRDVVLRLSFHDDTHSSKAVLFSILSLSSILRNGVNTEGIRLKGQALAALQMASNLSSVQVAQAQQHLAASILLCNVEVALASASTSFWGLFICGAKVILTQLFARNITHLIGSQEGLLLYQSIHYHDVLSKLSLRHWRDTQSHDDLTNYLDGDVERHVECRSSEEVLEDFDCLFDEVKLLDKVLSFPSRRHAGTSEFYTGKMEAVEGHLVRSYFEARQSLASLDLSLWQEPLVEGSGVEPSSPGPLSPKSSVFLFIAATRIYFERTVRGLVGSSQTLDRVLDDAFHVLTNGAARTKLPPFALFIIGVEARDEQERKLVVDAMGNSTASSCKQAAVTQPVVASGDNLPHMRRLIDLTKAMWIKQDMQDERDGGYFDYGAALHQVISSCEKLPSFL